MQQPSVRQMTLAGLSASLVGIGLARFSYAPLLPGLVSAGWFGADRAAWIGAANLAGYLAGAALAQALGTRFTGRPVLRASMLLATLAFFACAEPLGFAWISLWRFAAGLAGGILMVLAAPTVLPHVPAQRHGRVAGAIFAGVGIGIVASGTLVPGLLRWGLVQTWCGLGVCAAILTAAVWRGWPSAETTTTRQRAGFGSARGAVMLLCVCYGLNAIGLVPHMVFLADFVARGLGLGVSAGGFYWVLFGLGAVTGPLLVGTVADRIGFRPAWRWGLATQALAVAIPAVTTSPAALAVSTIVAGAFVPGSVSLTLGRVQELVDPAARKRAWSWCTTAFAIGQAGGAFALTAAFVHSGHDYRVLFGLGALALGIALAVELAPAHPALRTVARRG